MTSVILAVLFTVEPWSGSRLNRREGISSGFPRYPRVAWRSCCPQPEWAAWLAVPCPKPGEPSAGHIWPSGEGNLKKRRPFLKYDLQVSQPCNEICVENGNNVRKGDTYCPASKDGVKGRASTSLLCLKLVCFSCQFLALMVLLSL